MVKCLTHVRKTKGTMAQVCIMFGNPAWSLSLLRQEVEELAYCCVFVTNS